MQKWSQVNTSLWQFRSESLVESLKELHFEAGRIWRVSRLPCTFRSPCPQCFVFFWLADRAEALGDALGLFLAFMGQPTPLLCAYREPTKDRKQQGLLETHIFVHMCCC